MIACLGGWCRIREFCPHYNAPDPVDGSEPEDRRLCWPGQDGNGKFFPIVVTRKAGSGESQGSKRNLALAEPFDGIGR